MCQVPLSHSSQLFSGASLGQPWVTQALHVCEALQSHDRPQPQALPFVPVGATLSLCAIRVPMKRSMSAWSRDGNRVVWLCYWWRIWHVCCESWPFTNKQTSTQKLTPSVINIKTAMRTANAGEKKSVTWRRRVRMVRGALCDRSISYADIVEFFWFNTPR